MHASRTLADLVVGTLRQNRRLRLQLRYARVRMHAYREAYHIAVDALHTLQCELARQRQRYLALCDEYRRHRQRVG